MPDLLGWDYEDAADHLDTRGLPWEAETISPPGKKMDDGMLKVVKLIYKEGTYRLTLSKVPDNFR
jgi:hypothetical protein